MIEDKELQEVLTVLMEECGEVIQAASKLIRFGVQSNVNVLQLETEIGDLICMINLLEERDIIDMSKIQLAAKNKREKLKKWSNINV